MTAGKQVVCNGSVSVQGSNSKMLLGFVCQTSYMVNEKKTRLTVHPFDAVITPFSLSSSSYEKERNGWRKEAAASHKVTNLFLFREGDELATISTGLNKKERYYHKNHPERQLKNPVSTKEYFVVCPKWL